VLGRCNAKNFDDLSSMIEFFRLSSKRFYASWLRLSCSYDRRTPAR